MHMFNAITKWKYLKIILCVSIIEGGANLCFYGLEYAMSNVGYSFGTNNLLIGIMESITSLVMGQFVTNLPRKKTLTIMYGTTSALTLLFLFNFVSDSALLSVLVILFMRVLTTTGYFMVVMIET